MPDYQRQRLRCLKCQALFEEQAPTGVSIETWFGFIKGLRCPRCGAGSRRIGLGQNRTIPEDRSFPRGTTYAERIAAWWENGETGQSAKTLARLMSREFTAPVHEPEDLSDFRRCLLLLDRMPEWQGRLSEAAGLSPVWARLVAHWSAIHASFVAECGPDLDHRPAPESSALLQAVIEDTLSPRGASQTAPHAAAASPVSQPGSTTA